MVPMFVFVGIFVTGIFIINFGQFIPAWDSGYYKLLMSQNIKYKEYLNSKYSLMLMSAVIMFILSIPYVYFGWEILVIHFAVMIYNIGINTYILLYAGSFNRKKIDLGMVVFCHVTLDKQTKNNFAEFEQIILQFDEIISCSLVSGSFDYYLKVVTKDVETYNKFYQEKLAVLPMVAHINSLFVMDEIKTTTALPL